MEDLHCLLALVELEVLVELVEELEGLDDSHLIEKSSLEPLREVLLVAHELVGCAWLRLDLNLEGHVAPQVLELHLVVVLVVVPRHLVHLGVDALPLPLLDGVGVAVPVLTQKLLGFDGVVALESHCRVEDYGLLDDLGARHVEEYSMSEYLSRKWCRQSDDLSGSFLSRTTRYKSGWPSLFEYPP